MEFDLPSRHRARFGDAGSFRFGIEEEFFLCDAATLEPAMNTPEALFNHRDIRTGGRVNREMLQAQIEVATRPHTSCRDAAEELMDLRYLAASAASKYGLVILASGTHPTADWRNAIHTPNQRYTELMDGLQMVGRRNMLCAMHVHVELLDPDTRIDVMGRMIPYVPLLLALSTSSPFWQSQATGLKGYRLTAYDELPRTGMPELFGCMEDYDTYVTALVCSGAIPNATHVWWAVRPSDKYPTLELRATDCCTLLDDAIAIAALYRCLVHHLWRKPPATPPLTPVDRAIAIENKWRAQRYGVETSFATPDGAITVAEMLDQLLEQIEVDAEILNCLDEILHCRTISRKGSSADAQLGIFAKNLSENGRAKLNRVNRWIADATLSQSAFRNPTHCAAI
jgi:glutamate---cysteine ligase / carboxylate-amine ligase